MDLKNLSANDAQAYVNELETELGKNLTSIEGMTFFDVQDYVHELEKEVDHKRATPEYPELEVIEGGQ